MCFFTFFKVLQLLPGDISQFLFSSNFLLFERIRKNSEKPSAYLYLSDKDYFICSELNGTLKNQICLSF